MTQPRVAAARQRFLTPFTLTQINFTAALFPFFHLQTPDSPFAWQMRRTPRRNAQCPTIRREKITFTDRRAWSSCRWNNFERHLLLSKLNSLQRFTKAVQQCCSSVSIRTPIAGWTQICTALLHWFGGAESLGSGTRPRINRWFLNRRAINLIVD